MTPSEFRTKREKLRLQAASRPKGPVIHVGTATCGRAAGAGEVLAALRRELGARGVAAQVVETGCIGLCEKEVLVDVQLPGQPRYSYGHVTPEMVPRLVAEHVDGGSPVKEWVVGTITDPARPYADDPAYAKQRRIVLRRCGFIDPEKIEDYILTDGYEALTRCLEGRAAARAAGAAAPPEGLGHEPAWVIEEVKKSGLRGRGGAGFPTGLKWEAADKAPGDRKYIVCNADEGDPGAFMDRSVLEGDPHSVIEGMIIGAYSYGAHEGYIYCRAEYPLAVKRLNLAIKQAEEWGFLGDDILGSGFSFHLKVKEGAGAFVCGEETALLASIEGQRGMPRPRPPFPAQKGLWGCPTCINNVETFANVPSIILNGAAWYAAIGTEKSKGTKVFALAGKVKNTGLVEVPMGMPLGEIIFDLGGGVQGGNEFKAVQIGGPSGGCLPASVLDTPIDYDSLTQAGAIMGSGGMITVDETTCMVDLAKYFLAFVQAESCGKCPPCRVGTKRMYEILERITEGRGEEGDVERLQELAQRVKQLSLCGLGQTAPNPVLSTIRYFRHEYDAHIRDKKCPASACAALFLAPCQNACPAGVDVPLYVELTRQGRFAEAHAVVRVDNPLPMVCGRVCTHPCERKCRRATVDSPVAIRALKRFVGDYPTDGKNPLGSLAPEAKRPQKVAVVGSGPAGLTGASFLARLGYQVTVYEALPVIGGMLAVGIPEYRLPKAALRREVEYLEKFGVTFKTGVRVGQDVTLDELRRTHEAVFLAAGAHKGQKLGIPGEDAAGVYEAVSLLRAINLGQAGFGQTPDLKGRTVLVVGGGNAAIDAARSCLRLGARKVTILYRRGRAEMPALPEEVEAAEREGVELRCLVAPKRVMVAGGRVKGLEGLEVTLGGFDKSGRRRPVPKEGSEFTVEGDVIVAAVGQGVDLDGLAAEAVEAAETPTDAAAPGQASAGAPAGEPASAAGRTLPAASHGLVVADERTGQTNLPGVFAAGDCVTGPDSVIEAIAAGKRAASAIDKFLGGDGVLVQREHVPRRLPPDYVQSEAARQPTPCLPLKKRLAGFGEVELPYEAAAAMTEAARCLRCDVKEGEGHERQIAG